MAMRNFVRAAVVFAFGLVALAAVAADDGWLDCVGPGGEYRTPRTTACSNYFLAPEDEARAKWDWLERDPARGRRFIDQDLAIPEDPEEFGLLYGLPAWACAQGYTHVNVCNGGYWQLAEDVGYGYRIMVWIEVDNAIAGRAGHGTNTVAERSVLLQRNAETIAGEMDIYLYAVSGMNIDPATYSATPRGFEESFTPQLASRAEAALASAVGYCREYREAFRQALETLIAGGTLAESGEPKEEESEDESAPLVARATADEHVAAGAELELARANFRRLVVSGTVVDDRGKPIAGADVRIVPGDSTVIADARGAFRLEIAGTGTGSETRKVALRLVRPRVDVHGELTPEGDAEFFGVAADGASSLTLSITAVGVRPETLRVSPPALGEFVAQSPLGFSLVPNSEGKGRLDYKPPTRLDASSLERSLVVHRYEGGSPVWAAVVPLEFEYEDVAGNVGRARAEILVVRPPVMLVHGFLGNAETWARFADHLREQKFDAVVSEYFTRGSKNDSIPEQSKLLKEYIAGQVRDYARAGIMLARVDVVAHSMGGLIARYCGEEIGGTLRKILMVGTPNHGVSYLSAQAGALGSSWLEQHGTAGDQLYAGSQFLADLNAGEAEGQHLAESVQYANLIGLRSALSPLAASGTVPSDGVVDASSAHLNGVSEWTFPHTSHSTMLSALDPSITEAPAVWSRLLTLLVEEMSPAPLDGARIELRLATGRVEVARDVRARSWRRVGDEPVALGTAIPVRTGRDGRAVIGLYLGPSLWGTIQLLGETEVSVLYASPQRVHIYVASGTARLTTPSGAGHFEALLGAEGRGRWYEIRPRAVVRSLGTDVVVAVDRTVAVDVVEGAVALEASPGEGSMWGVSAGQRVEVSRSGEIRSVDRSAGELWEDAKAASGGHGFSWWSVLWILLGTAAALVLIAAALGL
jgi:pimeloyl-ACP methyl ester carboxylesterase